jgi:hypothetical protein
MSFSRWIRIGAAVCVGLWIAVPNWLAQLAPDRATPPQIESPIPAPGASPLASPMASPLPAPIPDPAECSLDNSCGELAPAPAPENKVFVPSVSEAGDASNQPPAPPPDLGTLLNYVAAGVIVVGVSLKIYWYVSDRRKGWKSDVS